jgi:flagellar motor switch protein FliM
MTATADGAWQLLSPDEIEAIVAEVASARRDAERARRPAGLAGPEGERGDRLAVARRALERFAREQARALASRFQRRIDLSLLSLEEARPGDLAAAMLADDRAIAFALSPGGEPGHLLVSRPLFFAWMRLAFGARDRGPLPAPERCFSPIELRFLRRIGGELVERLALAIGAGGAPEILGVVAAAQVREVRSSRVLLASLELSGFDEIGRVRVALPKAAFGDAAGARRVADPAAQGALAQRVLDSHVRFAVEAGEAELSIARLAALQVGDVLPVRARRDGGVVARVEGLARFHGVRGSVDGRLAIRIEGRLDDGEETVDGSVAER